MSASSSDLKYQDNYNEFDLLDEQIVATLHELSFSFNTSNERFYNETTVDQSQWKIWIDVVNAYTKGILVTSVKLQLVGYSWPDPSRYAIEFVIFTVNKEDGYSERIVKKKRIATDSEAVKEGTTFYWGNRSNNHHGEEISFKIKDLYIPCGVIIRILKHRKSFDGIEPKKQRIHDNKILAINGRRFSVNSHYLSILSPVLAAMFESDMKKKCEEEIEIKDVESSEHFAEFLRALSPIERCLPNPSNVLAICELANRFQVDTLLSKCERILRNCFEIPLSERFFFAEKHSLKGLMDSILKTMNDSCLKCFYLANKTMLDPRQELIVYLLTLLSRKVKPQCPVSASKNDEPYRYVYRYAQTNYSEFDVLDEQLVASVQEILLNNCWPEDSSAIIRYESIAFVDQSRWKIWIDVAKGRFHSVELQLVGYSWPDPSRYVIEFVVFVGTEEDGYGEQIVEKKLIEIDGEIIKRGTAFYGRKSFGSNNFSPALRSSLGCNEKQLFKIGSSYSFPFGIIIRILKRRKSFDGFVVKKLSIGTDKTLIVKGRHFPVNTHHLATCSPVFAAMFESDMKEKCEEEIEIKDVESSEHFAEFLRLLSPIERCLPNPSNVLAICELGDRFQVDTLLLKCERILRNCFEIPFSKRFFFAEKHSLQGLMSKGIFAILWRLLDLLLDDLIGSLDSSSLLRFYVVNKSTLDTRNDLVVKLLEHISRLDQAEMQAPKAEPLPPTPPQYSYTWT